MVCLCYCLIRPCRLPLVSYQVPKAKSTQQPILSEEVEVPKQAPPSAEPKPPVSASETVQAALLSLDRLVAHPTPPNRVEALEMLDFLEFVSTYMASSVSNILLINL